MLLVVKKRSLFYMLTGFLLVTISLGTYRIALHPNMQEWVQNKTVITRVNTVQKAVAITFDDGPDPDNTPLILNSLKKHNAKGTFFLVGRLIEKQAPLVRQIASQGHEIGNHSYSHADFNHKDRESIVGEIRSTNDLI
jgi:peptidoglycan/xylan/chitin deacetylase (PgdA/CDA1 family)